MNSKHSDSLNVPSFFSNVFSVWPFCFLLYPFYSQNSYTQSQLLVTKDEVSSEVHFNVLLVQANQVHRARMLASKQPHTGSWLNLFPLLNLGLHLSNQTLIISVALGIGNQVCESHVCQCKRVVDGFDRHGLSCRYSAGRHPHHANLNDVVKLSLAAAGVPS